MKVNAFPMILSLTHKTKNAWIIRNDKKDKYVKLGAIVALTQYYLKTSKSIRLTLRTYLLFSKMYFLNWNNLFTHK